MKKILLVLIMFSLITFLAGCGGGGAKLLDMKPASADPAMLIIKSNTEQQGPLGEPQVWATNNVILKHVESGETYCGYVVNRPFIIYPNIPAGTYAFDYFEQVSLGKDDTDKLKPTGDIDNITIADGQIKYGGTYYLEVKYSIMGKPKNPVVTRLDSDSSEDMQAFLDSFKTTIAEGKKTKETGEWVSILENKFK